MESVATMGSTVHGTARSVLVLGSNLIPSVVPRINDDRLSTIFFFFFWLHLASARAWPYVDGTQTGS